MRVVRGAWSVGVGLGFGGGQEAVVGGVLVQRVGACLLA